MATSTAKVTDSVVVELNGEQADVKGPAPDRLRGHAAEVKAYAARLRKENGPRK